MTSTVNNPLYQDVKKSLLDRILGGVYADKLPPIRILAEEFSISESTTKKIIDQLKTEKYLIGRQGKGVFINDQRDVIDEGRICVYYPQEKKGNPFYEKGLRYLHDFLAMDSDNGLLIVDSVEKIHNNKDLISCLVLVELNCISELNRILECISPNRILQFNSNMAANISSICSDNHRLGYMAMKHLYDNGHREIAVITTDYPHEVDYSIFELRMQGVLDFCNEHGLVKPASLLAEDSVPGGREAIGKLLDSGSPTAVFCFTDIVASGVLAYALREGIRIPGDLSVIGSGNMTQVVQIHSNLTTLEENITEMVNAMAGICNDMSSGNFSLVHELVSPTLIERESVDVLASEKELVSGKIS